MRLTRHGAHCRHYHSAGLGCVLPGQVLDGISSVGWIWTVSATVTWTLMHGGASAVDFYLTNQTANAAFYSDVDLCFDFYLGGGFCVDRGCGLDCDRDCGLHCGLSVVIFCLGRGRYSAESVPVQHYCLT